MQEVGGSIPPSSTKLNEEREISLPFFFFLKVWLSRRGTEGHPKKGVPRASQNCSRYCNLEGRFTKYGISPLSFQKFGTRSVSV